MLYSAAWTMMLAVAPLLVWRWSVVAARPIRCRHGRQIDPPVAAGVVLGLALVAQAMPEDALGFYAVFGVGGFWDVALPQLLALSGRSVVQVWPHLTHDLSPELVVWMGLAMGLWLAWLAVALPRPRRHAVALVLAAEAAVCLVSALGAGWTVLLLMWIAGRLNIWLLLVAILLIQDARYAHPPRSRLLIVWLWDLTGRFAPTLRWLGNIQTDWRNLTWRRRPARAGVKQSVRPPGMFHRVAAIAYYLDRSGAFRWAKFFQSWFCRDFLRDPHRAPAGRLARDDELA